MLLLAACDEVQDIFGVHAGLKNRALAYELADEILVLPSRQTGGLIRDFLA